MTTRFIVESNICSHKSRITSEMHEGKVIITVESSCKKIMDYGLKLKEINLREVINKICENPIYIAASDCHIEPNCLVPCGIAFCVWAEVGLISKNLLARFDTQCIKYEAPRHL